MKLFRRKQQQPTEDLLSLSWPDADGSPLETFPSEVVDGLRQMVTRMRRQRVFPARLAVASALRGEGVSTIARALAITLAHDLGTRVCLVDLNWWWPSSTALAAGAGGGLAAVLAGQATLDDALTCSGWPNLAYLPAGTIEPAARPVIARSENLRDTLEQLNWRYDHLVLDIPALLGTNDAVPLVSAATAVCLVIQQGATTLADVQRALREIDHLFIVGTILNRVRVKTPPLILNLIPS